MPKCLVVFCKNRTGKSSGVNFYRLTEERYYPWMKALGRNPIIDKVAVNSNAVCSEHFTENSFLYISNRKTLKDSAIPTLKLKPNRYNIFHYEHLKHGVNDEITEKTDVCFNKDPAATDAVALIEFDQPPATIQLVSVKSILEKKTGVDASSSSSSQLRDQEIIRKRVATVVPKINQGRKRVLDNTSTEGKEGSAKCQKNLKEVETFHNYSLPPRQFEQQQLIEIKEENKTLKQKLKTSRARVKRLTDKVAHLKDIVKDLKRQNCLMHRRFMTTFEQHST